MMEQRVLTLDDLCRFCLSNKCNPPYSLIPLNERHAQQFKDLTRRELPLNDCYPQQACLQCCNDLENMYGYKNLILQKQEELEIILQSVNVAEEYVCENDDDIIEEYLDDEGDDEEAQDLRTKFNEMPSVKNLSQTPNKSDILKLIEDIEKNNQLIYENSKPTVLWKKRKPRTIKVKLPSETAVTHNMPNLFINRSPPHVDSANPQILYETKNIGVHHHEKYVCSYKNCYQAFNSEFLLSRHLQTHVIAEPILCCDQIFETSQDYKLHKRSTHTESVCNACGKVLKNQKTLRIHLKSHLASSDRQYKCDRKNCFKAFNMKVHLENHLRIHNNFTPFECPLPQCFAAFKQKHQIKLHLRNKHHHHHSSTASSEIEDTSLE